MSSRYKPREKLKVNFGTPEFLAPEVINYEFVSFPTDMWSLGVITYMLWVVDAHKHTHRKTAETAASLSCALLWSRLSGLSPFLGEDDNETLNNILACQWNFEEEEFKDISDEAKDFITRLLVKSKSWRMSATESLRHAWLSDRTLHFRLVRNPALKWRNTQTWMTLISNSHEKVTVIIPDCVRLLRRLTSFYIVQLHWNSSLIRNQCWYWCLVLCADLGSCLTAERQVPLHTNCTSRELDR